MVPSRTGSSLPLVPAAAFVLVWSSGYISGPAAVHAAAPFTALGWRFVIAAVLAAGLAVVLRRPTRMDRTTLRRVALVGVVMNAVQFGLMYVAFDLGLGATLASLFHALSPVLTVLLGGLSMLTLSLGTLGQRWIGARPDLLWSAALQFAVSAPPLLVLGRLTEGAWPVTDTPQAVVSVLFLAVVNSIVGLVLLALLVLRGGSGAAASLFFLSPPVTAVLAWLVLDETLTVTQLVGLVVAVAGVGAATRSQAAPAPLQDVGTQ